MGFIFRKSKISLALAFISCNVFAQAPQSNLDEVLKFAIEQNPEVQASWHNFLSANYETQNIDARADATVDFFADYSLQYRNNIQNETYDGASARLSFSKMLWDGERIENQTQSFKGTELVRYFEFLNSVETTALSAYIAYQDVLRYRELAGLAQRSYNSHAEVYDKIAAGVETGHTRRADLEQINGRLALAESNLLTEKANLHDVSARFLRIVGQVPAVKLSDADLNTEDLPNSFKEVMSYAYDHNPAFHAAIRDIESKLAQTQAARSENKPRVDLTGFYNIQTYDDTTGTDTEQQNAKIALEFRYNLYNGDRNQTAISKALEDTHRAHFIRDKECVDMRQNLQISYNDVRKITEQLPILNQHRNSSDRVRTAFSDQFSINERSLLDLLDTEIEFFQSSRAYSNAHYDRNISIAKTLAEMGKLLSTLQLSRGNVPSLSDLGANPASITPEMMCPIIDLPEIDMGIEAQPSSSLIPPADLPINFVAPEADNTTGNSYHLEMKFPYNSSMIDSEYNRNLAELSKFMEDNPNTQTEIRGHASLEGPEKYNQWLSERRAKAVENTLINQYGADSTRIQSIGLGETQPLINAETPEANEINRRIEVNIQPRP